MLAACVCSWVCSFSWGLGDFLGGGVLGHGGWDLWSLGLRFRRKNSRKNTQVYSPTLYAWRGADLRESNAVKTEIETLDRCDVDAVLLYPGMGTNFNVT
jgi:hypothetical protein